MSILLSKEELNIREQLAGENSIKDREYLALVISNNDPLKAGRIQIRLSIFHRGVADADLPWASPLTSVGSNGKIGAFCPVSVGSFVCVKFLDGTGENIVYHAVTTDSGFGSLPEVFKTEEYPSIYGLTDQAGNQILVNCTQGTISVKHQSGSTLEFTKEGDININCKSLNINSQNTNITTKTLNNQAETINTKAKTNTIEASTYSNVSSSIELNSPSTSIQSNGTVDIQATSFSCSASKTNISGDSLDLSGATTNLSGSATVAINSASFACNATNQVEVTTTTGVAIGMVLPGAPSVVPVTPPSINPKTPTTPANPTDLEPLPVPEVPDVKEKVDF